MKKKQFEYGMFGLLIGIVAGVLLGVGELNWIKKSQRSIMIWPVIAVTVLVTSITGYGIGSKRGKQIYIESKLGIDKASNQYFKDGRYWVGITTWVDWRHENPFTIETKRIDGILCSSFNSQVFRNHGIPNANQQTVPKYHKQAVQEVFDKLVDGYTEDGQQMLNL